MILAKSINPASRMRFQYAAATAGVNAPRSMPPPTGFPSKLTRKLREIFKILKGQIVSVVLTHR